MDTDELNSIWATIGGIIKYFRFGYDYVLWGVSWANITMLIATIPKYKPVDFQKEESIDEKVEGLAGLEDFFKDL